jgi:hypothetical protein
MSEGRQLRGTKLKIVATYACRITTGRMKHGNESREIEEQNAYLEQDDQAPENTYRDEGSPTQAYLGSHCLVSAG